MHRLARSILQLLATAALAAVPLAAECRGLEAPERYLLPNGLEVILQRDDRQPYVAVVMSYRAGSRDDPEGYGGLAHLVEHVTFRGSKHVPDLEMLGALERAGGSAINATTALDATTYFAIMPEAQVPLALWIESERMAFTLEAMTRRSFENERAVVINERRDRGGTDALVARLLFEAAYPQSHPYHRAEVGAEESLAFDHVRSFYQSRYRPDNATLALVGRFEPERARETILRYFGPIAAPGARTERVPAPPVRLGGQALLRVLTPSARSQVTLFWPVPCDVRSCGVELELLRALLAGSEESLLGRELLESGVATSVSMGATPVETHLQVVLRAEVSLRHEPADVHAVIDRVLERLQREGPPDDELAIARTLAITSLTAGFEPLLDRATTLIQQRSPDRPEDLYDPLRETERARAMTREQLREAALRLLSRDRRIVVYETAATGLKEAQLRSREGDARPSVEAAR